MLFLWEKRGFHNLLQYLQYGAALTHYLNAIQFSNFQVLIVTKRNSFEDFNLAPITKGDITKYLVTYY